MPLSMVSLKRTEGSLREQETQHAQLDMLCISPVICSRAGVASVDLFPISIFSTGQSK